MKRAEDNSLRRIYFSLVILILMVFVPAASAFSTIDFIYISQQKNSIQNQSRINVRPYQGFWDWLFGNDPTETPAPMPIEPSEPTITPTPTIMPTITITPSPTPIEPDYSMLDDIISLFGEFASSSDISDVSIPVYDMIQVPGFGTYIGTIDEDRISTNGAFFLENGDILDGTWIESYFTGLGYLIYPGEGVYEGAVTAEIKGALSQSNLASIEIYKNGFGKFLWTNGDSYEGTFVNDNITGGGRYTYSDGSTLTGTFDADGFITGEYKTDERFYSYLVIYQDRVPVSVDIVFPSGSTFGGTVEDYQISGDGVMIYEDGDSYMGKYSEGKRNGEGIYEWSNGSFYNGDWVDDTMTGNGLYVYSDGRKLDGEFDDNKFVAGTYIYTSPDGITYEFIYSRNTTKPTSVKLTDDSGATFTGTFTNGSSGNGTITYPNGDVYTGYVDTLTKEGQGTYTWADGSKLVGTWKNDKVEGSGQYYYKPSDQAYMLTCSAFKNGKPDGECYYYLSGSVYYKTDWEDGKCVKVYQ